MNSRAFTFLGIKKKNAKACVHRRVMLSSGAVAAVSSFLSGMSSHSTAVPQPSAPALPCETEDVPVKKSRRSSAKKSFDAYLKGRRAGRRPDFCIPKLSFERVVHHILAQRRCDMRIQRDAVDLLQETAEGLLNDRFQKCAKIAELCRRDTVKREHWVHVRETEDEVAVAGGFGAAAAPC